MLNGHTTARRQGAQLAPPRPPDPEDLRIRRIASRFGLTPALAAAIAELAFVPGRRR